MPNRVGNNRETPYIAAMPDGVAQLLIMLLVLFQAKHFVCDGLLQTAAMVRDKGHYGRWLGIKHAGIHGIGTLAVMSLAGIAPSASLALALADFALHYHIDFGKEQIVRRAGWTTSDPRFWWSLSADQVLHQLTYVLLAAIAVKAV